MSKWVQRGATPVSPEDFRKAVTAQSVFLRRSLDASQVDALVAEWVTKFPGPHFNWNLDHAPTANQDAPSVPWSAPRDVAGNPVGTKFRAFPSLAQAVRVYLQNHLPKSTSLATPPLPSRLLPKQIRRLLQSAMSSKALPRPTTLPRPHPLAAKAVVKK
jgi:hypothetical protein